jgi:hypothetical protein
MGSRRCELVVGGAIPDNPASNIEQLFENSQAIDYKALGTFPYNVNARGPDGVGPNPAHHSTARKIFERIVPVLASYVGLM